MLTLIAYDITDPKRLHKVAKLCEDYGMRIQYSVFECRLEADRFETFWKSLVSLIDPSSDRVTAYKICASCSKNILDAGVQMHSEKVIAYVF
jgi:CRISPR-associated protein Cas2